MKKLTRRELAGAMMAAAATAQTAPQATPHTPTDELQAAHEQNQRVREALAKTPVAMDTEPAFHFTA